jgi:arginase
MEAGQAGVMADRPSRFAIVEAPSILGLKPTGVEGLPEALRRRGLVERLGAREAARLASPPYLAARAPDAGTLNADGIAQFSRALADAVGDVLRAGERPLVLGGDCSILLGSLLACRRRGRYGLLFLDGHADFYQPEANPNGEAASMDLAFATGRGPAMLADLDGLGPLVRDGDVVAFGFRDHDEQRAYGSQPLAAGILAIDLPTIRRIGIDAATTQAIRHLARPELEGLFVHVDADVLDDAIMPAVDYRQPGGLRASELSHVLRAAIDSGRIAGLDVTIYNPALDRDGEAGRRLADVLVDGLAPRPRA